MKPVVDEPVHERRVLVPAGLLLRAASTRPTRAGAVDHDVEHHRVSSMIQFGSKLSPPSNENDCCQRADDGVMSVQSKRTLTVAPVERVVALEATLAVAEAADDRRVELAASGRRRPPDPPEAASRDRTGADRSPRSPGVPGSRAPSRGRRSRARRGSAAPRPSPRTPASPTSRRAGPRAFGCGSATRRRWVEVVASFDRQLLGHRCSFLFIRRGRLPARWPYVKIQRSGSR